MKHTEVGELDAATSSYSLSIKQQIPCKEHDGIASDKHPTGCVGEQSSNKQTVTWKGGKVVVAQNTCHIFIVNKWLDPKITPIRRSTCTSHLLIVLERHHCAQNVFECQPLTSFHQSYITLKCIIYENAVLACQYFLIRMFSYCSMTFIVFFSEKTTQIWVILKTLINILGNTVIPILSNST